MSKKKVIQLERPPLDQVESVKPVLVGDTEVGAEGRPFVSVYLGKEKGSWFKVAQAHNTETACRLAATKLQEIAARLLDNADDLSDP